MQDKVVVVDNCVATLYNNAMSPILTIKALAKEIGITRQGVDRRIKSLKITPEYLTPRFRILTIEQSEALKGFSRLPGRPKKEQK